MFCHSFCHKVVILLFPLSKKMLNLLIYFHVSQFPQTRLIPFSKPLENVVLSAFIYQKNFAALSPALAGTSSRMAAVTAWNLVQQDLNSNNASKLLGQGEETGRCSPVQQIQNLILAVSVREVTEKGARQEQCLGFISRVIKPRAVSLPGKY